MEQKWMAFAGGLLIASLLWFLYHYVVVYRKNYLIKHLNEGHLTADEKKHLLWIHARLQHQHDDHPGMDFMIKFLKIIQKL